MYTHKQNGPNMDIYRGEVHIATFDPVEEETTFTEKSFKRFTKAVNTYLKKDIKEVHEVKPMVDMRPGKDTEVEPKEKMKDHLVESDLAEPTKPKDTLKSLRVENMRLRMENVKLGDEVVRLRTGNIDKTLRVPDRFSDPFDDSEGKPLMGPYGDMTPEYVDWARENMPEKIFERRYRGRTFLPESTRTQPK
jgi:hypothetical protein